MGGGGGGGEAPFKNRFTSVSYTLKNIYEGEDIYTLQISENAATTDDVFRFYFTRVAAHSVCQQIPPPSTPHPPQPTSPNNPFPPNRGCNPQMPSRRLSKIASLTL